MPSRPIERDLSPRIKVWLAWKGGFLMGPNYFHFLGAVDQTGPRRRFPQPQRPDRGIGEHPRIAGEGLGPLEYGDRATQTR